MFFFLSFLFGSIGLWSWMSYLWGGGYSLFQPIVGTFLGIAFLILGLNGHKAKKHTASIQGKSADQLDTAFTIGKVIFFISLAFVVVIAVFIFVQIRSISSW